MSLSYGSPTNAAQLTGLVNGSKGTAHAAVVKISFQPGVALIKAGKTDKASALVSAPVPAPGAEILLTLAGEEPLGGGPPHHPYKTLGICPWAWTCRSWAWCSPPSTSTDPFSHSAGPRQFFPLWGLLGVLPVLPGPHSHGARGLGGEDPLEKGMATHSPILAWETPWTEEPGGPQSMGLQRFRSSRVRLCATP